MDICIFFKCLNQKTSNPIEVCIDVVVLEEKY